MYDHQYKMTSILITDVNGCNFESWNVVTWICFKNIYINMMILKYVY